MNASPRRRGMLAFTWGSQADHWWLADNATALLPQPLPLDSRFRGRTDLRRAAAHSERTEGHDLSADGYHEVFSEGNGCMTCYSGPGANQSNSRSGRQVAHSDPRCFLREARQWMQQWLKGDSAPLPLEQTRPIKRRPNRWRAWRRFQPMPSLQIQDHLCLTSLKKLSSRTQGAPPWRIDVPIEEQRVLLFRRERFHSKPSVEEHRWLAHSLRYADYKNVPSNRNRVRIRAQLRQPRRQRRAALSHLLKRRLIRFIPRMWMNCFRHGPLHRADAPPP